MNVDRASFLVLTAAIAAASITACSSSGSDVGSGGQAATEQNAPAPSATPPVPPAAQSSSAGPAPILPAVEPPSPPTCTIADATVSPLPFQEGACFDLADPLSDPGALEGHANPDVALLAQCEAYAALLRPAVAANVEACMRAARDAGGLAHPLTTVASADCATKALHNVCLPTTHPSAEAICFEAIEPAFEGFETDTFVSQECVATFSGLTDAGAQQVKQCMLDSRPTSPSTDVSQTSRASEALASCIASMKPPTAT